MAQYRAGKNILSHMGAKSPQLCLTLCNPMDCSLSGSPFMRFSRQEYWSGLPCPPPGDLPDPGIEPASLMSPALAASFFTTGTTWEAIDHTARVKKLSFHMSYG